MIIIAVTLEVVTAVAKEALQRRHAARLACEFIVTWQAVTGAAKVGCNYLLPFSETPLTFSSVRQPTLQGCFNTRIVS